MSRCWHLTGINQSWFVSSLAIQRRLFTESKLFIRGSRRGFFIGRFAGLCCVRGNRAELGSWRCTIVYADRRLLLSSNTFEFSNGSSVGAFQDPAMHINIALRHERLKSVALLA